MADAEMWRLGRALIFGVLGAVATANCGGESKTNLDDEVVTGGKSSSAGAVGTGGATGGAGTTGGAATGGAKASGGTGGTSGGSPSTAGVPATAGTGTGGRAATGGATATGGEPSASGGSATGGRAATVGGRAAMGGRPGIGGDGMGGNAELPDDSCLEGCEVAPQQTPLCGERLTWVCSGTISEKFKSPECEDAVTQVPRFCCTRDFRPCE